MRGLVKAVFATETLALGINMPARTVVLERLVKFNGEAHVELTPGEYTQLTGRAGRRGIDVEGHAVVVWTPGRRPARRSAGWPPPAPTRCARRSGPPTTWPSTSSTGSAPTTARELLEQSFAQFQADRRVVGLSRRVERNREALAGYARPRFTGPTSATSPSTWTCAAGSPSARSARPAGRSAAPGRRRRRRWRRCAPAT